jgi:hypothetical protein
MKLGLDLVFQTGLLVMLSSIFAASMLLRLLPMG